MYYNSFINYHYHCILYRFLFLSIIIKNLFNAQCISTGLPPCILLLLFLLRVVCGRVRRVAGSLHGWLLCNHDARP